jgi:hypothetical protein
MNSLICNYLHFLCGGIRSNLVTTIYTLFGDDSKKSKLIQEAIKRRLNSGNACYRSVQNLLSSRLLPKNLKIRIQNFACGSVLV